MFSVIARHHDGKTSIWHSRLADYEEAMGEVTVAVTAETGHLPVVVLACIKGGKE